MMPQYNMPQQYAQATQYQQQAPFPTQAPQQYAQAPQFGYTQPNQQPQYFAPQASQPSYTPQGFSRLSQNGVWNNAQARNNYDLSQTNTGYGTNRFDIASGAGKLFQTGGFSNTVNNQGSSSLEALQEKSTWAIANSVNNGPFKILQRETYGSFANVRGGGEVTQDKFGYGTTWVSGDKTGATVNQTNGYNATVYTQGAGVTVNQDKVEYATFVQKEGGGTFNQNGGYRNLGFVSDAGGNYNQTGQHNAFQAQNSGVTTNQNGASSLAYLINSGSTLNQQGGTWATAVQHGGGSKIYQGNTLNDGYIIGGSSTIDQGSATAYRNRLVNTGNTKFSQNAVADNIVWNNGGGIDGSQTSQSGVNWAIL